MFTLEKEFGLYSKWLGISIYFKLWEGIPGAKEARRVKEILRFQGYGRTIILNQRKLNVQN